MVRKGSEQPWQYYPTVKIPKHVKYPRGRLNTRTTECSIPRWGFRQHLVLRYDGVSLS
jgi:hypothetical protein